MIIGKEGARTGAEYETSNNLIGSDSDSLRKVS